MATQLKNVEKVLDELPPDTLHAAMARAFAEIEGATKDSTNPHFRSKYADLSSVIAAIKPALVDNGLFFTQHPHPAEGGVCVETFVYHRGGEALSLGTIYVPANKQDAQGYGSAITYARRYALQTGFGVPTEDDDGNAASRQNPNQGEAAPANNSRQERIAEHKNDPFPQGPATNLTQLKTLGRTFWRDVEACGDADELECLLADKGNVPLLNQIMKALPSWWDGGHDKNGEVFEGLEAVIARKRRDFEQLETVR